MGILHMEYYVSLTTSIKCREDSYFPSWSICVDESMSAWRGKDEHFCSDGMPHVT